MTRFSKKCERNEKQKFLNDCGWKTSILGGGKLKFNIPELHLKTIILVCKSNVYNVPNDKTYYVKTKFYYYI